MKMILAKRLLEILSNLPEPTQAGHKLEVPYSSPEGVMWFVLEAVDNLGEVVWGINFYLKTDEKK